MTTLKVLATGPANGKLKIFFDEVTKNHQKFGPFDLLLCLDLFGENTEELDSLMSGELSVPIMTYFMHGEHELPDAVKKHVESNQGELCHNLFYLGQQGSITTTHGIKIVFVSGIMESMMNNPPTQVDILLTYEWPKSITRFSKIPTENIGGSEFVSSLAAKIKPRYHFAASEKIFFKREPYQNIPSPNLISDSEDTQLQLGLPTWFVGFAEVNSESKGKWYYGFNLVPYIHLPPSTFMNPPQNMTECPFIKLNNGQKRGHKEIEEKNGFIFSSIGEPANKRGRRNVQGPPPVNYVCNKCSVPGHWINECPEDKSKQNIKHPHANYVCNKCNAKGSHFMINCPNYTCKLCGDKDHAPKNCPNPTALMNKKKNNNANNNSSSQCWFCITNPKTVKHLIISKGKEIYLSLARGSLIDTQNPDGLLVPGGGHALLVAVPHCSSFREIPIDEQVDLTAEIEKYKSALKKFFHAHGSGMVLYEVSFFGKKNQHSHMQVIPVPLDHDPNKIRETFIEEAENLNLNLLPISSSSSLPVNYFKVDLPDGTSLVHEINPDAQFDVQFGRKTLGKLLGLSNRINWRECTLPEELEKKDAENFRQAFSSYDPMNQNNS
ncbi:hypothetical protein Glove_327g34 [Diversispora epigaea]|uniref:CCHC-type domain-containing protein n=1 Tax=Diversispora epigaea TaxID=1348612 RepID=A0A397HL56_9GLOM|nr:hypothetical protein Glove_327g34 [Diversispora epigaea]